MAAAGTVVGQLHALARFVAHPDDLVESPLTRAWAVPATEALRALLDWRPRPHLRLVTGLGE